MEYNPSPETRALLDRALGYVQSVSYAVTARWVFYRLLQDGTFLAKAKADYKRLLGYLSKARKAFQGGWRPDTLADDTRAALVGGIGFDSSTQWLQAVTEQERCFLDKWEGQPTYVELWFEAAAMTSQFEYYAHRYVPLLAFHGDISIPEKWKSAQRLVRRWRELRIPIKVLYYGDLDEKGLEIPLSAERDVRYFASTLLGEDMDFEFIRVGINEEHVQLYGIPENPERPGTYQWEGLPDDGAQALIEEGHRYVDEDVFTERENDDDAATQQFRDHLQGLNLEE